MLRVLVFLIFFAGSIQTKAQKIESIYANLYTDSLKKGTYNYINIDGKLDDGTYLPLDSTHLIFGASDGKFIGNTLYLSENFSKDFVTIKATLRTNPALCKEFKMYIKKAPDPELKTEDELMQEMKSKSRKRKS